MHSKIIPGIRRMAALAAVLMSVTLSGAYPQSGNLLVNGDFSAGPKLTSS